MTVARRTPLMLLSPLRRRTFRRLWLAMSTSYAGDRLQQLAQGWLVAITTDSAVSVGLITVLGSLPLLLIPLGGVIAEQSNLRRVLLGGQLVGAVMTCIIVSLLLSHQIAIWHIYAWAFVNGAITLLMRPAYKVVLTEAVPTQELRAAIAINAMTETGAMVVIGAAGSVLLGVFGLPIAFVLNAASYLVAAATLWAVPGSLARPSQLRGTLQVNTLFSDLWDGIDYLWQTPSLLHPLLLTFAMILLTGPILGLLPAIVQGLGGTIVELGLLSGGVSVGSFGGALFAGTYDPGERPMRMYGLFGLVAAAMVVLFALTTSHVVAMFALGMIGFVSFAEAVWNTARIRQIASLAYQARLQALTSLAFTLGLALGTLWASAALECWGVTGLLGGAFVLALCSLAVLARQ